VIAVVHELRLEEDQRRELVDLLRSSRDRRPKAIIARLLWCEGKMVHLLALWESRDALDRYLATTEAPPVTEMHTLLGAEVLPRIVEVGEYG
jgi:hypothetical protein